MIQTGAQAGIDLAMAPDSGRPMYPSLFIMDLGTLANYNAALRTGDWQEGNSSNIGILPGRVYGTWKGATRTYKMSSPAVVTVKPDADPAANVSITAFGKESLTLRLEAFPRSGPGLRCRDRVECRYLAADGKIQPGHIYRFQFMVHDGDQKNSGGDVGEACTKLVRSVVPLSCSLKLTDTTICGERDTEFGFEIESDRQRNFEALPNGGTPPYTYSWSSNPAGFSSTSQQVTVSPSANTSYTVVVSDSLKASSQCVATVEVNKPPVISQSPRDTTVCEGGNVCFSATASGTPAPTLQWQVSTDGGTTWKDISGATSSPYCFAVGSIQNGYQYHAVFTNTCGSTTSGAGKLTVYGEPLITLQPKDTTVCDSGNVCFRATASGTPTPTLQWQVSTDGGTTWNNILNATSNPYCFTATASQNGYYYHAVFANVCVTTTSGAGKLTVNTKPVITLQPKDSTICEGGNVCFSATASGASSLQWQVSTDGGTTWKDISGATSSPYCFAVGSIQNGYYYHAVFTNACGSTTSGAGKLTVYGEPLITLQPKDTTVCDSGYVCFRATASGTPTPTLQWQVSTDGGTTWNNILNATSNPYCFTATASQNGYYYHAVFTNVCVSTTSGAGKLTVNKKPVITLQPKDSTICDGGSVCFSATASGALSLQWQVSTDGGTTWNNILNATSSPYCFTATASQNGYKYHAVFTNTCGPTASGVGKLTVNTKPVITLQPKDSTICDGGSVCFSATASGASSSSVAGEYGWGNNVERYSECDIKPLLLYGNSITEWIPVPCGVHQHVRIDDVGRREADGEHETRDHVTAERYDGV